MGKENALQTKTLTFFQTAQDDSGNKKPPDENHPAVWIFETSYRL